MFCKSQGVNLKTTYLEDGVVIVWKEFEKSITLIGSAKGITENVLRDLLELTFNAIILFIGYNEIKHNKNIDRLKREFKVIIKNFKCDKMNVIFFYTYLIFYPNF